jgi:Fe-S-cluster-containing dehydrogenase component
MNQKQKKYAIAIDPLNCIDCKACLIACKVENKIPESSWRNWIKENAIGDELRTQYQPGQCMQCDDPSCVAACPVDATFKGENGLVEIDLEKCVGCGNCITACPYDARYRNASSKKADKCDFCNHRLKVGEIPACVETCPTKTRVFGDLNDPDSDVSKLLKSQEYVRIVNPLINTLPNLYYRKNTDLLHWPKVPTLPGGIHMSPQFWKTET